MSDPTLTTLESEQDTNIPHFSLAFFEGEDDPSEVDFIIGVLENPTDRPASNALLTGLAILALERQGYVGRAIEKMFPSGTPTEREATEYAALLVTEEHNNQAV